MRRLRRWQTAVETSLGLSAFCIFLKVPWNRHPPVLREGELASLCCCCHRNNNTVTQTTLPRPKHRLGVRGENPECRDGRCPFHEHGAGLGRKGQVNRAQH